MYNIYCYRFHKIIALRSTRGSRKAFIYAPDSPSTILLLFEYVLKCMSFLKSTSLNILTLYESPRFQTRKI